MSDLARAQERLRLLRELLAITPKIAADAPDQGEIVALVEARADLLVGWPEGAVDTSRPQIAALNEDAQRCLEELDRRDQALCKILRERQVRLRTVLNKAKPESANSGTLLSRRA